MVRGLSGGAVEGGNLIRRGSVRGHRCVRLMERQGIGNRE